MSNTTTLSLWEHLVSDAETLLSKGPKSISVDRASWQRTVDSLDRLIDEIKSEQQIPRQFHKRIVALFHKIFQFGKDTVDYWAFKHMCLFAMCHIYKQYIQDPQALMDLVQMEFGTTDKDVADATETTNTAQNNPTEPTPVHTRQNFIQDCLIASVGDAKREVRDAVAQNFGALVSVAGNDLIDLVLPQLLEEFKSGTKEAFEGLMMTCGYLASCCNNISESNWNTLTDLLHVEAENTQFEAYSRYVRTNAVHGLTRVMRASTAATFAEHANMQFIKKAMRTAMKDEDIDVRRAVGHLFEAYYTFFTKLEEEPQKLLHDMLDYCMRSLEEEGAQQWEVRHGIACALENVSQSPKVVEILTLDSVKDLMGCLRGLIRKEDTDKSSFAANAVAGSALTHLLITLVKFSSDEKMVSQLFEEYGQPDLEFMLQSSHPQLLDAAARCIDLLITHASKFVTPYMERFMSLLYKNRYHAAYPIRSSADIIWRKSYNLIFKEKFASERDLLTHLTPQLLDVLLESSKHTNYEVRETVYQAMSDLLKTTQSPAATSDVYVGRLYDNLIAAANDMTGGSNSDYPRAASIRALASFLAYLSYHLVQIPSDNIEQIDALVKERLDSLDETIVVKATLKVVEVIAVHWRNAFEDSIAYYAALSYKIAHMIYEDEIRFAAIPAYLNCFGQSRDKALQNNTFLHQFCDALKEQLNEDKDEAEREAVARVLRDISTVDFSKVHFTGATSGSIMEVLLAGLTLPENAENTLIRSSCLLFLVAVSESPFFQNNFFNADEQGATLLDSIFKVLRGEEELTDTPDADFTPLDSEQDATTFEVCLRILSNLVPSSSDSSQIDRRDFYAALLDKTMQTYSESGTFADVAHEFADSLKNRLGITVSGNAATKPSIKSVDDFFSQVKKPHTEESVLSQQWDQEDDELNDERVFLAEDAHGLRYGARLSSGVYAKSNQVIDAAVEFVQNASSEDRIELLRQMSEYLKDMSTDDNETQNLLFALYFALNRNANILRDDLRQTELLTVLEGLLDQESDPLVWLNYGVVLSILQPDEATSLSEKIASADWRVELSGRSGEGILAYVAVLACFQAIAFKSQSKVFDSSLQVLSDILNDVNIVENKELIKIGLEQLVAHVGPQVTPDPTPASEKSNSTFVSS